MSRNRIFSLLTLALLVGAAGCEADREAAEQVDPSPNPAIEQAPAMPTPPVGVPPVGSPEAAARARAAGDTLRQDTLRLDTLGRDTAPRRP